MPLTWQPTVSFYEGEEVVTFPEDAEESDKQYIKEMIENYFNTMYPEFEPEIISTFDKQYYLPALKVLNFVDGKYYSPGYPSEWKNGELEAECKEQSLFPRLSFTVKGNSVYFEPVAYPEPRHKSPAPDCDCGIYGSVNLEEIYGYLYHARHETVLCIVEPSPEADVILCRKGWKASRAFISEIVNETVSIQEASQLLSMAWNRHIEIGGLYENR